jgi:hypothetical protein
MSPSPLRYHHSHHETAKSAASCSPATPDTEYLKPHWSSCEAESSSQLSTCLEQQPTHERTTEQSRCHRCTKSASVSVSIRPSIRLYRPHVPHIRVSIDALLVRIVSIRAHRRPRSSRWLNVDISALAILSKKLRLSSLKCASHGLASSQMCQISLALLLCPLLAVCFALFVRRAGELVLHLARDLVDAFQFALTARSSSSSLGRARRKLTMLVVAVLGLNVVQRHGPMHALMLSAFFGTQRGEELFVIVRVDPRATRRVGIRVDEKLVLLLGIKLANPARRERSTLVLHGAAVIGRYAIAFCAGSRAVCGNTSDRWVGG